MTTEEIKTELRELIENETDQKVLEEVRDMLQKPALDSVLKAKLTSRALKSEEDIKAGRVYSSKQVKKFLKDRLGI